MIDDDDDSGERSLRGSNQQLFPWKVLDGEFYKAGSRESKVLYSKAKNGRRVSWGNK